MHNKENNFGHFSKYFLGFSADRYSEENWMKYEWTISYFFHMERLLYKLLQTQIENCLLS